MFFDSYFNLIIEIFQQCSILFSNCLRKNWPSLPDKRSVNHSKRLRQNHTRASFFCVTGLCVFLKPYVSQGTRISNYLKYTIDLKNKPGKNILPDTNNNNNNKTQMNSTWYLTFKNDLCVGKSHFPKREHSNLPRNKSANEKSSPAKKVITSPNAFCKHNWNWHC